jgi:hypothetical protein
MIIEDPLESEQRYSRSLEKKIEEYKNLCRELLQELKGWHEMREGKIHYLNHELIERAEKVLKNG